MSGNDGIITLGMVPENILNSKEVSVSPTDSFISRNNYALDDFENIEKKYIEKALSIYGADTDGKKLISEKMNIGLTTLYRKMKKYGI